MLHRIGLERTGVLGERNVRLFFVGYTVSLTGSAMAPVALTFAILGRGGSAGAVGLVLASETAALVVCLLAGGVLADRMSRRRLMLIADLMRFVAQLLMAALLVFSSAPLQVGSAALTAMMGLAVMLGAGQAAFGPGLTGLVPEIASPARLQDANALIGMARPLGQIAGPALAGLLVASGGAAWAILVDALTYGIGALCLARLDMPPHVAEAAPEPVWQQLRLGWREFSAHAWLWIIVLQFGFQHLVVFAPFYVLGAVVAQHSLGGASAWGLILSAHGLGAVLGGLWSIRLRPERPLAVATLTTFANAPMLLLLAWPGPLWAIGLAAMAAGGGVAIFTTLFDTTLQQRIPPHALSRVSSYDWLGSMALFPLGYALAGPAADLFGIRATLCGSALWLVAASALVLALPAVHGVRR